MHADKNGVEAQVASQSTLPAQELAAMRTDSAELAAERSSDSGSLSGGLAGEARPRRSGAGKRRAETPPPEAQPPAATRPRTSRAPRGSRCGECESCLNPQRKKACLVRRQEADAEAAKAGEGRGEEPTKEDEKDVKHEDAKQEESPASAPPVPSTRRGAAEAVARGLQSLLASDGGVHGARGGAQLAALARLALPAQRPALCTVLRLSDGEALEAGATAGLCSTLEVWLEDAARLPAAQEAGRGSPAGAVLAALARMPMSVARLRQGGLGKAVGRLRKHAGAGEEVRAAARELVAAWKLLVDGAGGAGGEEEPRPTLAPAAVAGVPREARLETADVFAGGSGGAKPRARAAARVVLVPSIEAQSRAEARDATTPSTAAGPVKGGASAAVARVGASPLDAAAFAPAPRALSSHLSAAERAAAAAAAVPDEEEPAAREKKLKGVRWAAEGALEAVRHFFQAEAPALACREAAEQPEAAPGAQLADGGDQPPAEPRFKNAARREHLSEAAALRSHRLAEESEQAQLAERLARMQASLPWSDPPALAAERRATAQGAGPARGGDSVEARRLAEARASEGGGGRGDVEALTPREPHSLEDRGEGGWQRQGGVGGSKAPQPTRIPYSLEEAEAWAAARAAAQERGVGGARPAEGGPSFGEGLVERGPSVGGHSSAAGNAYGSQRAFPGAQQQPVQGPLKSPQTQSFGRGPPLEMQQLYAQTPQVQQQQQYAQTREQQRLHPGEHQHQHSTYAGPGVQQARQQQPHYHGSQQQPHHQAQRGAARGYAQAQGQALGGGRGGHLQPGPGRGGPGRGGGPPPGRVPMPLSHVPCRFFNSPGGCRSGNDCRFLHERGPQQGYGGGRGRG